MKGILLDFDGPACRLFQNTTITETVLELKSQYQITVEVQGPISLLIASQKHPQFKQLAASIEKFETVAAASATPTKGIIELLHVLKEEKMPYGFVTNNSKKAAEAFLETHNLPQCLIIGREDLNLLKPNPTNLQLAKTKLGISEGFYVGDQVSDMIVAQKTKLNPIGIYFTQKRQLELIIAGAKATHPSVEEFTNSDLFKNFIKIPAP